MTASHVQQHAFSLRQAVATHFEFRPSFRETLRIKARALLMERYFNQYQQLAFISDMRVIAPGENGVAEQSELLEDELMRAVLEGRPFELKPRQRLDFVVSWADGRDKLPEAQLPRLDNLPKVLNDKFNTLLAGILDSFVQDQVDYWNRMSQSRPTCHQWVRQALRISAMSAAIAGALDADEQACLRDLLQGRLEGFVVNAVEVELTNAGAATRLIQPDLLVIAQNDVRNIILWCTPRSVTAFRDLDDFAEALTYRLGAQYQFDSLSWSRYLLEGDVFELQSGLLLDHMMRQLLRLRLETFNAVEDMEQALDDLTDPSSYFARDTLPDKGLAIAELPWMTDMSGDHTLETVQVLLDLAVAQQGSDGVGSLDGIEDLHTYATRCLKQQMLLDQPGQPLFEPDDLQLEVLRVIGATDPLLPAATVSGGSISLTELAIGNFDALAGGVIGNVSHARMQALPAWLNAAYLQNLIVQVNVGGTYPGYVSDLLYDSKTIAQRIARFAKEWRFALADAALNMRVQAELSWHQWQAVAEFCRSGRDLTANVSIHPLAFTVPGKRTRDTVSCMFVLVFEAPSFVLLFSPLRKEKLCCHPDLDSLMAAIATPGDLQTWVLQWLPDSARAIYDNGGFKEPHVTGLSVFDPSVLPDKALPAQIVRYQKEWLSDYDVRMFQARRQALIELADRQSVSNAEYRWGVLQAAGCQLFNVVAPLCEGPISLVGWIVAMLQDVEAWQHLGADQRVERSLVVVDLLSSMLMSLFQGGTEVLLKARVEKPSFEGLEPSRSVFEPIAVAKSAQSKVHLPDQLNARADAVVRITSGWGDGPLAQRKRLERYAADVDLNGVERDPVTQLYTVGKRRYVKLNGEAYRVSGFTDGTYIVDEQLHQGPALWQGADGWRIKDQMLMAGQPPRLQEHLQARFQQFRRVADRIKPLMDAAVESRKALLPHTLKLQDLQELIKKDNAQLATAAGLPKDQAEALSTALRARIAVRKESLRAAQQTALEYMEAMISKTEELIETSSHALELGKYVPDNARLQSAKLQKIITQHQELLITDLQYVCDELAILIDFEGLIHMAGELRRASGGNQFAQLAPYRQRLAEVTSLQGRRIKAMEKLDRLLSVVGEDVEVSRYGAQMKVSELIQRRRESLIDVAFRQALCEAELALDQTKGLGFSAFQVEADKLAGEGLRTAARAHAELMLSRLTAPDKVEILQNAWHEYSSALIQSYDLLGQSAAWLDTSRLIRYREQLTSLKQLAGQQHQQAILEMEGEAVTPARSAYPVSSTPQHAVYTHDGQLVIASERSDDQGVITLEVYDSYSETVLHRFDKVEDAWVERVAEPVPVALPTELQIAAEQILADDAKFHALMQEYVKKDVSSRLLKRLIASYSARLERTVAGLEEVAHADLRSRLNSCAQLWQGRRQALLTELYSKTAHPDVDALQYLQDQKLLKISYSERVLISNGTALDKYRIELLSRPDNAKGKPLWEAHFHFARQDDSATAFTRGHLKTWRQRKLTNIDSPDAEPVHYGRLTLAQATGIIPF